MQEVEDKTGLIRRFEQFRGHLDAIRSAAEDIRTLNYRQYEDSYTKNGGLAMRDVLGQVSARTGGLASSYAATAAQQSYNNYMDQLADKIPELQQLAYQMYLNEGAADRSDVELLMALESADYNRYLNALGQYNTDRSFAYGQHRDSVSDDRYAYDWNYNAQQDAVADDRYRDELAYQREQDFQIGGMT